MTYDLEHTCKIAADELQGVALRANTLTFTTGEAIGRNECCGVRSIAGRWRCILYYIQKTRILMVPYTAYLITLEIMNSIKKRFPSLDLHFRVRLLWAGHTLLHSRTWMYPDGMDEKEGISLASFDQALEYLIDLMRAENETMFDELASRAFDDDFSSLFIRQTHWRGLFSREVLTEILAFKIIPWSIPSEAEHVHCFWSTVRDIVNGDSLIYLNGDAGPLWDMHELVTDRKT
ncbi:hypothetical protein BU23DRAFT_599644 [Bimuria novae-zelandiae CBS 107.79]|uniref:Uncharacterized protein n=1 Tax=Bimuria novae-zelandiae CBS 107.79 TaxID=1447943 RepID=A0A6A5V5H7_9PLEO|nr:hypothetical protein BU23DRAFT_599644 [Bimuria novae-zelandiae CBS 107.79]